jgi:gliding motility-associated-like protein
MMVVNGETTIGAEVWCETVNVLPNTDYVFETWVTTVVASNPAQLQFSINGVLVGNVFQAPSSNCLWLQFFEVWSSGGNTTAEICITNQNTIASGNDFAIDDIFFGPLNPFRDTVFVDVNPPTEGFLDTSVCEGGSVIIDGESYDAPGSYLITLSGANQNGCDSILNLNVTENEFVLIHEPPLPLDCTIPAVQINASGSTSGPGILYNWSTIDGNIIAGQGSPVITVNEPGTYTLVLEDLANGDPCFSEPMNVVVEDISSTPNVWISEIPTINCSELFFNIVASTNHLNFVASWTTIDGNILSGANTLQPTIDREGTYELFFLNSENGCDTTLSVIVSSDVNNPVATIEKSGDLDCNTNEVTLSGSASIPTVVLFLWESLDLHPIPDPTLPSIQVSEPGTYILSVTDPGNGCTDTAEVMVRSNREDPHISLPDSLLLTCSIPEIIIPMLDIVDTSGVDLVWSGDPLPDIGSGNVVFDEEGTFTLTVTDRENSCSTSAMVQVLKDTIAPVIEPVNDSSLSCLLSSLTVMVEYTEAGSEPSVIWKNLLNGSTDTASSLEIRVPGPYEVSIFNTLNGCQSKDSFNINSNDAIPGFALNASGPITCTDQVSSIVATFDSDLSNLQLLWEPMSLIDSISHNGDSIYLSQIGPYSLTAIDTLTGCSFTDSMRIMEDRNSPVVEISGDSIVDCSDPTSTLTASAQANAPVSYFWATSDGVILSGAERDSAVISGPGTYTVTGTNSDNGCISSDTILVTSDENLPIVNAGPDTTLTCTRSELSLDGRLSSTGPNFIYAWSTPNGNITTGENGPTPTINSPGDYMLLITDVLNGCINSDIVQVTMDTIKPGYQIPPYESITCSRDSVELELFTGVSFEIDWSTTDGVITSMPSDNQIIVKSSGNYDFVITSNINGCINQGTIEVTADTIGPFVSAQMPDPITCVIDSSIMIINGITADPTEITWTGPSGTLENYDDLSFAIAETSGSYVALVRTTANGCSTELRFQVIEDKVLPLADAGPDMTLSCVGEAILDASGSDMGPAINMIWQAAAGNPVDRSTHINPVASSPGQYILRVENLNNGCVSTDTIHVFPSGEIGFELLFDPPTCKYPESQVYLDTVIGANEPLTFHFEPGGSFPGDQLPVLSPGDYSVTMEDAAGCLTTGNISIPDTMGFTAYLPSVIELEPGESLQLQPQVSIPVTEITSILWTGQSIQCDTCFTTTLIGSQFETISVRLIDRNGCIASPISEIVLVIDPRVYIPNAFSPNGDGVNDQFGIFTNSGVSIIEEIIIFNRWGDKVFERLNTPVEEHVSMWDGTYNGKVLDNGVFVYHVTILDILGNEHFFKGEVHLIR